MPQSVTGLPSRSDLATELARRFGVTSSDSLAEVAARVSRAGSRYEFTDFIRNALNPTDKLPRRFHRQIVEMVKDDGIGTVITIAYDNVLEMAFQRAGIRLNRIVSGSDVSFIRPSWPTLVKLYGDSEQPDSLVVTERDHSNLLRDRHKEALVDEVRRAFRSNTVLFLGYNLADPDFRFLFDEIAQNRFARTAYAVWPGLPEEDVQMWRDRGTVILDDDPFEMMGERTLPVPDDPDPEREDEQSPIYDTAAIRQLLFNAFGDDELLSFCFDHFPSVYQDFGQGMSKSDKIQRLLDYCRHRGQFERLLEAIRKENPNQYEHYMEGK